MRRDVGALQGRRFDVLVIGGGIYGAWTAYDAALRGLRVALIDKGDWAAGTSSASTKLIHGGLRYLERFRFGLVRKSLQERRLLSRLAPHQINPVRFVIPSYRGSRVGRMRMRAGLKLYDWLAGDGQPVERHETLSRESMMERYPFLNERELLAGFSYGDCQMDDARFALEIVAGVLHAGGVAVNYVEALELRRTRDRIDGVRVRDLTTNHVMDVDASVIVNTAGPWAGRWGGGATGNHRMRMTKGVHLVMPPLPSDDAFLFMAHRDGRVFFLVPWYGMTLLGTTDTDFDDDPSKATVETPDIDYLLSECGRFVTGVNWTREDIRGRFAGVRVLKFGGNRNPSALSREWVCEQPEPQLIVSLGGKYTSARADAARMVDRAVAILGRAPHPHPPTETLYTPWSPNGGFDEWRALAVREGCELGLDEEAATLAARRYGTAVKDLFAIVRDDPSRAGRLVADIALCEADIVFAARHEMVVTLEDILRRRVPLLVLSPLTDGIVSRAATLAAPALGWSPEQRDHEVRRVLQLWPGTHPPQP